MKFTKLASMLVLVFTLWAPMAVAFSAADAYPDKATITTTASIALVSTVVLQRNPARKGLIIYNNSANSVYLAFGPTANSATTMTMIIPTFAQWIAAMPIYTGQISAIRNAGLGSLIITELY